MKIILLQAVAALGRTGDIKDVSDGYARNFLLPQKLAEPATDAAIALLAAKKAQGEQEKSEEEKKYRAAAEKLKTLTLALTVKTGGAGKTFGSVNAAKIQDALRKQGILVEKNWILLASPIKATGGHALDIKFPHGIMGKVQLMIEAEQ